MSAALFIDKIMREAKSFNQRTGQYLFNCLPSEVGNVVAGTLFDPFHKDLSKDEVQEWVDNHLIFDGDNIVGCFSDSKLLWDGSPKDTNA